METKEPIDLDTLLGGSVDDVSAKFGDLDDAQLADLKDREGKGGNRSTLIEAIDRETKTRADNAAPKYSQNEMDAAMKQANDDAAEQRKGLFTQADMDAAVKEAEKRGKATATAAAKPKPAKEGPVMKIADGAEAPALVAQTGGTKVVFADEDDRVIAALPGLDFSPSDFQFSGANAVLKKEIDFPTGAARTAIASAWLLDGSTVVGKASLVQPFWVGGGRQGRLPAGTLSFAGAKKADATPTRADTAAA